MFKTKKQTNKNTINKKTKIVKKNDKQTSVRSVPEVVKKKTKKIRSEKTKTPIVTIAETPIIETTNTKKTKRTRKPKAKMYFTSETEDSIIEYNSSDDQSQRNDIYNIKIKYAFEKLVENVFNTFKFCYFETSPLEVQKETVAHLVANIHKFESGKGKAFSYFSIIAKNYLIFQNNTNYKRFNQHVEIGEDNGENTYKLQHEDVHYKEEENREFLQLMVIYWEKNVNKIFTKQRDINIANAVIELFRNSDRIDAFNKKALYLYIREISSCKTQQITKVINRMKNYQNNITKSYVKSGNL
jgi:hypothetical protein